MLVICLVAVAEAAPAQAASYFYSFVPPVPSVTCSIVGGHVRATTGGPTISWNVPAGNLLKVYVIDNGVKFPLGTYSIAPGSSGPHLYSGYLFVASESSFPVILSVRYDLYVGGTLVNRSALTISCPGAGPGTATISNGLGGVNFTDGRCNQEPWQSVAVYPDNTGGYNFYALYNGVGYFAMHVTEQNLDDNPDTGVTHRIAEAKGAQLIRLAGGGLRVDRMGKDNKMYSFNIGSCGAMED